MIDRRRPHARIAVLAAAACIAICVAGCKQKDAAENAASPAARETSDLASRLNAMPPSAQIDTLRAMVAADTANAQLQFFAGNAYYSFASGLDASAANRTAYLDSATAAYTRAVTSDSTMSKAYVNMGLAYQEKNQPSQARSALERAIEVNPEDVLAYCHLGYLAHVRGDLTEAMRQYNLALTIDPSSPQAHYNLGLAFAEAKIFPEAVREWQLVIKHDPGGDLGKTAAENVRIIEQYMNQ
jgi:tetratricopeptide (TPR) repeat protein